jgi:hypothetical protein
LILRGAALVAIGMVVAANGPLAGVLVLASLFTVAGTAHKPAQAGLLTQAARTPAELAAANVLWSSTDYVAFLGGSVLAAVMAALWGLEVAFAICAVLFGAGAIVLLRVLRDSRPAPLVPATRRRRRAARGSRRRADAAADRHLAARWPVVRRRCRQAQGHKERLKARVEGRDWGTIGHQRPR